MSKKKKKAEKEIVKQHYYCRVLQNAIEMIRIKTSQGSKMVENARKHGHKATQTAGEKRQRDENMKLKKTEFKEEIKKTLLLQNR